MRLHSITGGSLLAVRARHPICLLFLFVASLLIGMPEALAHAVAEGDKGFIQESSGVMLIPFIYMGAKHMMTGYDHLLFLFGVIFFLYRLKDVGLYVTLFAVGHSVTLLFGVLTEISISSYIIDAIIGFSVVYKAMTEPGGLQALVRLPAEHQSRDARLRPAAWLWPGNKDPGVRNLGRRPDPQPHCFQCRG